MTVKISTMWLFLLGGVIYDLAVDALQLFPDRTLSERLGQDCQIAWFIMAMWFLTWLERSPQESASE